MLREGGRMSVITLRGRPRLVAAASSVLLAACVLMLTSMVSAAPASASTGRDQIGSLPYRVFAPYFETYDTSAGSLATQSQESGAKFLSLAFLQTATAGSCVADWDGDPAQPIGQGSFGSDIAAIQARGGNVIPSFGGFTADTTDTEIADSCSDGQAIAGVF